VPFRRSTVPPFHRSTVPPFHRSTVPPYFRDHGFCPSTHQPPPVYRAGLSVWAWLARRPALYHALVELACRTLGWLGGGRGRFRTLPLANGWTAVRDMPVPEGRSFHSLWAERQKTAVRQ